MKDSLFLGIDTSNYKTSIAIIDGDGNIIKNISRYLQVKKGERGLRQSAALFQHIINIPTLLSEAFDDSIDRMQIKAVSVSNKPRPIEGSYMPVFNSGYMSASSIASALNVPLYSFSHQEGHLEAIKHYSPLRNFENEYISFHFSGGTTEALKVKNKELSIVGGTKDIAFGQVLDRVGVSLGMSFPAGEEMDKIAISCKNSDHSLLPIIKVEEGYINLSGIETCCQRLIGKTDNNTLIECLFYRLSQSISNMIIFLNKEYNIDNFIFAGGVSSSDYFRTYLKNHLPKAITVCFGDKNLSTDNAVGIALLGRKEYGA